VDILVVAYSEFLTIDPHNADDPNRDRFILSKGHATAVLYATLAEFGFFPQSLLSRFGQPGSPLAEQMYPYCLPGVEAATGSLGHGLSLGLGMAMAGRLQNRSHQVWVLLSDGECNEGSVWEAAMFAAAQGLENVVAMIDYNGWQATGRSDEIMALDPLVKKWESFGWETREVDGHDCAGLINAMRDFPATNGRPTAIVARTIKGAGVSFMEDDNNWHYRIPNDDELQAALVELGQA
jgi:transketolase